MRQIVLSAWAIAYCQGFTFGPPSVPHRPRRHRPSIRLATADPFNNAARIPKQGNSREGIARKVKQEDERGRLMSALNKAVHARPKRPQTCEAAVQAVETYLASRGKQPHPKEWTMLISGWGAAQRPDQALRCLSQAEVEMARHEQPPSPSPSPSLGVVASQPGGIRPKAVLGAAVGALCSCGDIEGAKSLLQVPIARPWGSSSIVISRQSPRLRLIMISGMCT